MGGIDKLHTLRIAGIADIKLDLGDTAAATDKIGVVGIGIDIVILRIDVVEISICVAAGRCSNSVGFIVGEGEDDTGNFRTIAFVNHVPQRSVNTIIVVIPLRIVIVAILV